ncbi:MAG: hypothetical protein M3N18_13925 [Actinomycetota bacterium]|nr:hypothetical protein [Actinomycetota bacterium]
MDFLVGLFTHPLVSLVLGGLITLLVSRGYYRKASDDLVREAGKLREQNNLMLRALQEFSQSGNVVEYNADPETGEPKGLHIKRTIGATSKSNVSLDTQVIRAGGSPPTPPGGRLSRFARSVRSILGTARGILRSLR